VTIFYAIFGMPLFLMWASQMGTFLAQTFQFLYSNVCCALCRHGYLRTLYQCDQIGRNFDIWAIFLFSKPHQ
jgi:hypothetical protein